MREIINITGDPSQRHIIELQGEEITLDLRFFPTVEQWFFNVSFQEKTVKGVKLSVGTLHVVNTNFPFDFIVTDTSGGGIDPFKADDFETARCKLYILDPDNMETFRGVPVEI